MKGISKVDSMSALIPALIQSASETFQTMVFRPITAGQPLDKAKGWPSGYISGTISFTGEDISGNISLIFGLPLAKEIFRSMMGLDGEVAVNAQEINDVVGELANIVAGGAKSKLQEQNIHFKIGLPTVIVGENHFIEPPKNVNTTVIPFTLQEGEFYLEISC